MMTPPRIGVLGAGAWGTALALVSHRAGCDVTLCAHTADQAAALSRHRTLTSGLPGITIPDSVTITSKLADLQGLDALIIATPAQAVRATVTAALPYLTPGMPLILTSKGIEQSTYLLMTEVVAEVAPGCPTVVLSGPSFAVDVAAHLPTAVVMAADDEALAERCCLYVRTPLFRTYTSTDVIGVQVGGALKNVLAIAAGICWGLGLGDNARAALLTRGLAELTRLGVAMGGRAETFRGLSGLGDLMLTCSSTKSRNMSYGMALAGKEALPSNQLAEGVFTAQTMAALWDRYHVEMPIALEVYKFLQGSVTLHQAVSNLMERPSKSETLS